MEWVYVMKYGMGTCHEVWNGYVMKYGMGCGPCDHAAATVPRTWPPATCMPNSRSIGASST